MQCAVDIMLSFEAINEMDERGPWSSRENGGGEMRELARRENRCLCVSKCCPCGHNLSYSPNEYYSLCSM